MTPTTWGSNKDANKKQLLNLLLQSIAGDHSSPIEALIHYNSTAKRAQVHNGTALKQIAWTTDITSPDLSGYATDTELSDAIDALRDEIIGGASAAYDTLQEIQAILEDEATDISGILTSIGLRGRGKYFVIGDGSATTFNLDHNFSTKRVMCQAFVVSTGAQYEPDFDRTTTNRVVVTTGSPALSTGAVEVLIQEIPVAG